MVFGRRQYTNAVKENRNHIKAIFSDIRMGRKKKDFKPIITEENKWLADDFLRVIGTIYDEYMYKFRDLLHWSEDIIQDSILRTYQTILWNGCKSPVKITRDTPEEARITVWKNKWFIACRNNNTVGITSDRYRTHRSDNDITDVLRNAESVTAEEKIKNDIYDDYRTIYLLEYVCARYDPQTCHCFRIYYMIPGMTYKKLSDITKLKDAKTRVVEVNKHLREHLDEINAEIDTNFKHDYPDFAN